MKNKKQLKHLRQIKSAHNDGIRAQTVQANLMHIGLALNGVAMLLEEISETSQDKAHEISWACSIVKMITGQVEQTEAYEYKSINE